MMESPAAMSVELRTGRYNVSAALPGGTAAVGDLGMVGVRDSIIGDDVKSVIRRFITAMPTRLPVAEGDTGVFNSVLIDIDEATGLATTVERVDRETPLW